MWIYKHVLGRSEPRSEDIQEYIIGYLNANPLLKDRIFVCKSVNLGFLGLALCQYRLGLFHLRAVFLNKMRVVNGNRHATLNWKPSYLFLHRNEILHFPPILREMVMMIAWVEKERNGLCVWLTSGAGSRHSFLAQIAAFGAEKRSAIRGKRQLIGRAHV